MTVLNRYEDIPVSDLIVNPNNDRHGPMDDELDAMNWLLQDSRGTTKKLARDIAEKGQVYNAPLVSRVNGGWLLHDGNRRVTCAKLLQNPMLAKDTTWQRFFGKLSVDNANKIPNKICCRIEDDEEVIEDIVFRLHAGGDTGVGTVGWDPRQQQNHAIRTGKLHTPSLGVQIEKYLKSNGLLDEKTELPVRNLERLLSSERYTGLVGIKYKKDELISFSKPESVVQGILKKICSDLIEKKVTIDKLIKNAQKDEYFKELSRLGYLPEEVVDKPGDDNLAKNEKYPLVQIAEHKTENAEVDGGNQSPPRTIPQKKRYGNYLIPEHVKIEFDDGADIVRMEKIVEELKRLPKKNFINACAVLFRVLVECATNYYNETHGVSQKSDKLHITVKAALDHMVQNRYMVGKDAEMLNKFAQQEEIISAHTFHGWVHSNSTSPSEQHLEAMWDSFAPYLVICAKAKSFK